MPQAFDATAGYWQEIVALPEPPGGPYRRNYPARLPDGRYLVLPLRAVPGDDAHCVASFIANHAALDVVETLAGFMARQARRFAAEVVVGLPTLGLAFAPLVARGLGFSRYVPFGYSRKYWYDDALAVPVRSLTTPDSGKMLYVDPNLAGGLRGRRVLVVDDAVSTGQTMGSALTLLERCGADVAGVVVAMRQGRRWRELRDARGRPVEVEGAFDSPRMRRAEGGWMPD
ncbi:phosphoribosyltransferase [Bordetella hinzii]|uniref:Phosphoribosyltransferase n=2 Tax=Bordetella hinzii TaxID=103855 RepID=A0AAN1VFT8_9BORD|nr:phosphoribosyltransferase [Bordetella hinzii]AKQ57661.1 phosphoribosyltransferase [Bordetella hinzii]AKQ62127.1 phosphoribosyltransferase [Bordetella hinzii]AZW16960.1 phosphoribosyltransferase [Bordetella hinzii]KCB23566.1 phosphoribosyl transferase domain protein [Bordetella hinzii OH87 BAL007II]KCB32032.1 phosphoribosyl transferase domain protein [Bordetella hinzii CA90 BAL1384]